MKYHVPKSEDEVLPNKLNLSDPDKIAEEEYRGFLKAEIQFESILQGINEFDWDLVSSIHRKALGHIYDFAGELREVNISKEGFLFPAAKFLPTVVHDFEMEFLKPLSLEYSDFDHLIEEVAPLHAELLYIHPFREGNGRTVRLLSDLIALKSGHDRFKFEGITEKEMPQYILAVQSAADQNYVLMKKLFKRLK